jgi:hypothetical protein
MMSASHPPTRLLVLRDREAILTIARAALSAGQLKMLQAELDEALQLADDEATLVMASIKAAWHL